MEFECDAHLGRDIALIRESLCDVPQQSLIIVEHKTYCRVYTIYNTYFDFDKGYLIYFIWFSRLHTMFQWTIIWDTLPL